MIRIRVIFIGHNSQEFLVNQRKYREDFASDQTRIETVSVKGGPETIEQDYDEIHSCPYILDEVKRAEQDGADAAVIDCALDPCLSGLREAVRIPVVGAGQSAFLMASALGDKWSILTPLPQLIPGLRRRIDEYGFAEKIASFRSIETGILDLLSAEAKQNFIKQGVEAVNKEGAEVLILGCTGMSPAIPELKEHFSVPLVDPAASAICLAENMVRLNLSHSPATFPYIKT